MLKDIESSGKDIFEGVKELIYDPPESTGQILDLSALEHDRLHLQDIGPFVELRSALRDVKDIGT